MSKNNAQTVWLQLHTVVSISDPYAAFRRDTEGVTSLPYRVSPGKSAFKMVVSTNGAVRNVLILKGF